MAALISIIAFTAVVSLGSIVLARLGLAAMLALASHAVESHPRTSIISASR